MTIEKVSHGGVAANQNNLLERRTAAALFQQPEQALDGDVHDLVRSLLAGRAMQNMSDAAHGPAHCFAIGDASLRNFQARPRLQNPVMTEGTNPYVAVVVRAENSIDEMAAYFAGSACDQNEMGNIRA